VILNTTSTGSPSALVSEPTVGVGAVDTGVTAITTHVGTAVGVDEGSVTSAALPPQAMANTLIDPMITTITAGPIRIFTSPLSDTRTYLRILLHAVN
jgi:hypothetical protein